MKIKLYLKRITDFCPTQWKGRDSNGLLYYIRYRWGILEVRRSRPSESPVLGVSIVYEKIGGDFDGVLSNKELKKYLKELFKVIFLKEE